MEKQDSRRNTFLIFFKRRSPQKHNCGFKPPLGTSLPCTWRSICASKCEAVRHCSRQRATTVPQLTALPAHRRSDMAPSSHQAWWQMAVKVVVVGIVNGYIRIGKFTKRKEDATSATKILEAPSPPESGRPIL